MKNVKKCTWVMAKEEGDCKGRMGRIWLVDVRPALTSLKTADSTANRVHGYQL